MPFRRATLIPALCLSAALALAGCESSEERAERYFRSGMALLEKGDVDRALVEFRNVFKLDGKHKEARLAYARAQRDRGEIAEAYSQYLRLVEQYPDNLEGRRALAEMAARRGDWEETARHGRAARELAPDDLSVRAVNAALDYRAAMSAADRDAAMQAVAAAQAVLAQEPGLFIARRVVIDQLLREGAYDRALAEIDAALALDDSNLDLHQAKLRVLAALQDEPAIGAHLKVMYARFPDNRQIRESLILWHVQTGDLAGAEAFLRQLAETGDAEDARQASVGVVQFLLRTQGPDAARQELARLVAAGDDTALYRSLRASIDFDAGETAGAIAEMEAILKDAPPSEQTRNLQATLARMLEATGNYVGARALVEEILEADPSQVAALRMRASWLIDDDRPGEAVAVLRRALDQEPRDIEVLTLMARAHLRAGSRELAGDRLAMAVEISGQRAEESLRYARFLVEDGRLTVAESVLIDALRRNPVQVPLLAALGDLYLRMSDWPRTGGVIRALEKTATAESRDIANRLRVALLFRQQKIDESIAFLKQLAAQGAGTLDAPAVIVQAHLQNGRLDQAEAYLDALLAERPDDPGLRFLRAGVHAVAGEIEPAEEIYRDLIAAAPGGEGPIRALHGLLRAAGRPGEARAVLDSGLEATGRAPGLLFLRARALEGDSDMEAAIAVYEELYARDSDNPVIANNLASLLTAHRSDDESLNRAFTIARRLRGSELPPFQDTYGWIEFRRGNYPEALAYLEPAAAGLPDDALVQFHLGLTYAALERTEEARATLERALELAGDSPLPQFTEARKALAALPDG